jgi:hypothetical protein
MKTDTLYLVLQLHIEVCSRSWGYFHLPQTFTGQDEQDM